MFFLKTIIPIMLFLLTCNINKANSVNKIPTDECKNLDHYLYHCKIFHCKTRLLTSEEVTADIYMSVGGYSNQGKCIYQYDIKAKYKNYTAPFDVSTKCMLSKEGIIEAMNEFNAYKSGKSHIYMSSTDNPILHNQCVSE